MTGWIGVDFDGTLAHYEKWQGAEHTGAPVVAMVDRVKRWLADGREVRIFTARVWPIAVAQLDPEVITLPPGMNSRNARVAEAMLAISAIRVWSHAQFGVILPVTCVKDYGMIELWDDRAVQVKANTGEPVGGSTCGLV